MKDDFVIENVDIYKVETKNDETRKLKVITKDKIHLAIQECHIDLGNHLGRDKTVALMRTLYYWKGMCDDVKEYLRRCEPCQMNNKKTVTAVPEMTPVDIKPKPFQKVGIDLIGPFLNPKDTSQPLSANGYRYVLNIMDYYTKFPESYCLFTKSAAEVAEKIFDLRCRYGMLEIIISDMGGEFNNKLMKEVCKYFKIKHINTSAYHPQANGMIERFNQTMKSMINKTMQDGDGPNWDQYIQSVCYSYRITKHATTKYSPFFLLYNQHPLLHECGLPEDATELSEEQLEDHLQKTIEVRHKIASKVMDNIHHAQLKQKEAYDQRHKIEERKQIYDIGEKVLVKNFRRHGGLGHVKMSKFEGPYVVAAFNGRGNYKINHIKSSKTLGNINQKNIKKYLEQVPVPTIKEQLTSQENDDSATDTADDTVIPETDNGEDSDHDITCIPETDLSADIDSDSDIPSAQPNQPLRKTDTSGNNSSTIIPFFSDDEPVNAISSSTPVTNRQPPKFNISSLAPALPSTSTSVPQAAVLPSTLTSLPRVRRTTRKRKAKEASIYEYHF
jgi:transposase InsO family protein